MDIKEKNILVTGGAVRLGRAITIKMAELGARVFCHFNKSQKEAYSLKEECDRKGLTIELVQSDLTQKESSDILIQKVIDRAGTIDVLINNAALFFETPFGTIKESEWDLLFNLNLKVPFFCSQKAGQIMYQQGQGKIINIGDIGGEKIWPDFIPYTLTKNGLIAMTKGLAKALAPKVLVNCINLGPIMFPVSYNKEKKQKSINATLLKRQGNTIDLTETVRFLIIDSDYITGSVINLDGGRSIL